MKIRERCTCGAEFEMRDKNAAEVDRVHRLWQQGHLCTFPRLEGWPEDPKAVPA